MIPFYSGYQWWSSPSMLLRLVIRHRRQQRIWLYWNANEAAYDVL